jgi:ABC-type bacteriocin/lantibiotic exporter with double-glycine peptidase domain
VTQRARACGVRPLGREVVDAQEEETRRRIGESQSEYSGTSIAGLEKAARSYGLTATTMSGVHDAARIQAELAKGHLVIAHVKATYLRPNPRTGHYTVVTAIKDGKVYLNDSSNKSGPIVISEADFWHGVAARGSYTMISVGP